MTTRLSEICALACAVILAASNSVHAQSGIIDCSTEQMELDPRSVIAPCSEKLQRSDLSPSERGMALLIRGRGYHRSGQIPLAGVDYDQALQLIPENDELWMSRANVYFRSDNYRMGDRFLAKAHQLNPRNALVITMMGMRARNMRQLSVAHDYFSGALSIDPGEPYARSLRATLLFKKGQFNDAFGDIDILVAQNPSVINRKGYLDEDGRMRDFHIVALVQRGYMFRDLGKYEQAEKDFNAAVAYKRSAESLASRAGFLMNRPGRMEDALADSENATSLDRGFRDAFYTQGSILVRLKRFQEAFVAFDQSVKIKPDDPEALQMRARMHRAAGCTDEAVQDIEAAMTMSPIIVRRTMPALRHAGYWRSHDEPREFSRELHDALRACMLDPTCN
jgi:tetratricopeptide (TPR) repeat protein